jgi:hypothetical protein
LELTVDQLGEINPRLDFHIDMTGPDAKHVDRWVLIDPKRGEFVTRREMWIREALGFTYRFLLSVFLSAQLFDLFFSSIWLHGYIW